LGRLTHIRRRTSLIRSLEQLSLFDLKIGKEGVCRGRSRKQAKNRKEKNIINQREVSFGIHKGVPGKEKKGCKSTLTWGGA